MHKLHGSYIVTLVEMHTLAKDAGLSFALGRAAHLKSRLHNAGHRVLPWYTNPQGFANLCIAFMRKTRTTTAKRWQAHILQGGSVRAISVQKRADLARRRRQYAKDKPYRVAVAGQEAYRQVANAYRAQAVASGMPTSQAWVHVITRGY